MALDGLQERLEGELVRSRLVEHTAGLHMVAHESDDFRNAVCIDYHRYFVVFDELMRNMISECVAGPWKASEQVKLPIHG